MNHDEVVKKIMEAAFCFEGNERIIKIHIALREFEEAVRKEERISTMRSIKEAIAKIPDDPMDYS